MNRIPALVVLALALVAAAMIAACGGDDGSGDEDPQQVLSETFSKPIQSGTIDFDVGIEASGGGDPGMLEAKLGGPFQGQGERFPQFDLDVSLKAESGAQSISGSGGVTSTGEAAFVNFQGTEYAVDQEFFDQYVSTYTKLQDQSGSGEQGLLAALGISPTNWMTDLTNEGTETVEGTETIHISGKANVPNVVEDLKTIARSAGGAVDVDLDQLDRLNETVQAAEFDVYSGESDRVLRRLTGTLDLEPQEDTPGAPESVTLDFELTIGSVNEPQTVQAPSATQPLSALFEQLGIDPSQIGSSLRGGLQSGGALPETGGSTTAPSADATEAYTRCLSEAEGQAELQQCAELLGG